MNDELRHQLGVGKNVTGVVVLDVQDGPAATQGLRPGDIILKIGARAVTEPQQVDAAVEKAKTANTAVLMLVRRDGHDLFLGFSIG